MEEHSTQTRGAFFIGEYTVRMDRYRRIRIPVPFREKLFCDSDGEQRLYMFYGDVLRAYSIRGYERLVERLNITGAGSSERLAARRILASTYSIEWDREGRITLPKALCEFIGADSDIVFAGVGDCFEIWSRENWMLETEKAHAELSESDWRALLKL